MLDTWPVRCSVVVEVVPLVPADAEVAEFAELVAAVAMPMPEGNPVTDTVHELLHWTVTG